MKERAMTSDIPEDIWKKARAAFISYFSVKAPSALKAIENGEYDGYPMLSLTAMAIKEAKAEERKAWRDMVDRQEAERLAMATDWSEFCAMIGVEVDTHEAVAFELGRRMADG